MAGRNSKLQIITNKFAASTSVYGMEISMDKSKDMVNTTGSNKAEIRMNGQGTDVGGPVP